MAQLALTPKGYAIGTGGPAADWLVVMLRLDETQTLEELLRARNVSLTQVQRLAEKLHQFYSHAPRIAIYPESYLLSLQQAAVVDRQVLLNQAFDLNRGAAPAASDLAGG